MHNIKMLPIIKSFISKEFFLYLLFGGAAAILNLAVGWIMYSNGIEPYYLCILISSTSGLVVNFLLNYYFNFRYRGRPILSQFGTFLIIALLGIFLTALLSEVFLYGFMMLFKESKEFSIFDINISYKFLSHFLSVGFVTIYSFLAHKFFSFNIGILNQISKLLHRS